MRKTIITSIAAAALVVTGALGSYAAVTASSTGPTLRFCVAANTHAMSYVYAGQGCPAGSTLAVTPGVLGQPGKTGAAGVAGPAEIGRAHV